MTNIKTHSKLLSIILCGRNDNYLGDFKYRIRTSINYASLNCLRADIKEITEIVVIDWNSKTPLRNDLELSSDANDICKFIEVPAAIADKYHYGGGLFNTEVAVNVGLRRCCGTYAMVMPADILLTETALRNIIQVLSGQTLTCFDTKRSALYLDRKHIPWQIVEKQPDILEWDRYIQLCSRNLFHDRYYIGLNGGYGGLMLHRDIWAECQGFIEDSSGWGGSDTEWGLRVNQKYPGISLEPFGIMAYDMSQNPDVTATRKPAKSIIFSNQVGRNNPDWGIPDESLAETSGCIIRETVHSNLHFSRPDQGNALIEINQLLATVCPGLPGFNSIPPGSTEYLLIASLAWYCTKFKPTCYLEFNCQSGLATLAYAALCPFGEIHVMDDYNESDKTPDFQHYVDNLPHSKLLNLGFMGQASIITGDMNTSLQRLRAGFVGEFKPDISIIRCDAFSTPDICAENIDSILHATMEGGAILISSTSLDRFNSVLDHIMSCHGRHHFLQSSDVPYIFLLKNGPSGKLL
ncbi:MAG: hypothetical protein JZU60_01035 [Ilumatobacteraceae bacterium]|nr:hypothetical protein [Ilumatobacteraceae bacterium]